MGVSILISIMEKNEVYDVTFKCPFNCIMSGSSGTGKTTKVLEFLELKDVLCSDKFYKTYYFYLTWQSIYDKMKLHKLVDYFIEGIPDHESLMTLIDNNSQWNNSYTLNKGFSLSTHISQRFDLSFGVSLGLAAL